jgi:hypothetical protein
VIGRQERGRCCVYCQTGFRAQTASVC